MGSSRALKAAGLILAAVVLGLLTVQGSYALWNKAVPSTAGVVQAADFRVTLTATDSRTTNMTLANGTAASLALVSSPLGTVAPGAAAYAGVQIGNVTNAGSDFRISARVAAAPSYGGSALAPHLSMRYATAATLAGCSAPSLYTPVSAAALPSVTIAKGASAVVCFQLTLSAAMPATLAGTTAGISIPLTVEQL